MKILRPAGKPLGGRKAARHYRGSGTSCEQSRPGRSTTFSGLAQLVERVIRNDGVAGSSPAAGAKLEIAVRPSV